MPTEMTTEEFDEAAKAGKFSEYHPDLFRNTLDTHNTGVMPDALQEVIKEGKLVLLEGESEGNSSNLKFKFELIVWRLSCCTARMRPFVA